MTVLQEYLNEKYPTREEREKVLSINIFNINEEREKQDITEKLDGKELDLSEYRNLKEVVVGEVYLKSPLTKLTLGKLPNLLTLHCYYNKLTTLDVSGCPSLEELNCRINPLTSLKTSPGWKERTWTKIRNTREPSISGLDKLIDTSDLDNWVKNYDWSKVGDIEYHKFCGSKVGIITERGKAEWFTCLDYITLDNLGNKVIARKFIILSRLLIDKKDFEAGKNELYEEKMNEYAEGYQMRNAMLPRGNWTPEQQQAVVNKALAGDIELLSRLQDLPYLNPEFQFPSTKNFRQRIQALEEEVETHLKALDTAQKWRERQIQELNEQKDKEIKELTKKLTQLENQQKKQTEEKNTNIENQALQEQLNNLIIEKK